MGYDLLGNAASESSQSRIICKLIGWDERVDANLITLLRVQVYHDDQFGTSEVGSLKKEKEDGGGGCTCLETL